MERQIEITLKHDDFECFRSIFKDAEIVRQEIIHHTVYDRVKVCVREGEQND